MFVPWSGERPWKPKPCGECSSKGEQVKKTWLFRLYKGVMLPFVIGFIYIPLWESLWNSQDSMESDTFFRCSGNLWGQTFFPNSCQVWERLAKYFVAQLFFVPFTPETKTNQRIKLERARKSCENVVHLSCLFGGEIWWLFSAGHGLACQFSRSTRREEK